MTDQEQRVAIAEACGWNKHSANGVCVGWTSPHHGRLMFDFVPDYLNDLNSMHEAEKVLTEKQKNMYVLLLVPKEHLHPEPSPMGMFITLHSTARQRAEAFLRTIGKWKDS